MSESAAVQELTIEQKAVVESPARTLKVNAFAGTGKTSTLVAYAKARPALRMLYIAFNKAIQEEAESKFPANVTAMTTHSIAYRAVGYKYRSKLAPSNRISDVAAEMNTTMPMARKIIDALNNYLVSADTEIGVDHIENLQTVNPGEYGIIVSGAREMWRRMKEPSDTGIKMVHDGYLKLFQLGSPKLDYDVLLFDEAQDANPVTSSIVSQQGCAKVYVGDSHQAIYGFRKAINAMASFKAEETLYLTRSFRFGRGVASVANELLGLKGENKKAEGAGTHQSTIFSVNRDKHFAIIARTNSQLFDEAVSTIRAGKTPHFVGRLEDYRFSLIMDAYHLWSGENEKIKAPHIRAFKNFASMEVFAEEAEDAETKILTKITKKYTSSIPALIDEITSKAVSDERRSDVTLTTAHKSKGLEFDQVVLTDDYTEFFDENGQIKEDLKDEEVNICYVAATRAQRAIEINDKLVAFLQSRGWDKQHANNPAASTTKARMAT